MLGEWGVVAGTNRTATVMALTEVQLAIFTKSSSATGPSGITAQKGWRASVHGTIVCSKHVQLFLFAAPRA